MLKFLNSTYLIYITIDGITIDDLGSTLDHRAGWMEVNDSSFLVNFLVYTKYRLLKADFIYFIYLFRNSSTLSSTIQPQPLGHGYIISVNFLAYSNLS